MITEREIYLTNPEEKRKVIEFLETFQLTFTGNIDYTMGLYDDDELIGTGSLGGRVMRDIAIKLSYQGRGLTRRIIRNLQIESYRRGVTGNQVYTKPENVEVFKHVGFKKVAVAKPFAALLESGTNTLDEYLERVGRILGAGNGKKRSAIIMNCNPFTLGHRAVIEEAARNSDEVVIFAVQEDRSAIPFSDRFALMKQGVADLRNVVVISGGDYIVSNATFPTYFIKGTDELAAQTRLDAMIFAQRIAPELNITARYVGEEPNDKTTMAYNQAMSEILPENGIELYIIPRKEINGEVISASKVRKAVLDGNWEAVASMVPKSTLVYLQSEKGNEIVKRIELMETIKGGIR